MNVVTADDPENAAAKLAGQGHFVMSATGTLDVCTGPARSHGNAPAYLAGEACYVMKVRTNSRYTNLIIVPIQNYFSSDAQYFYVV